MVRQVERAAPWSGVVPERDRLACERAFGPDDDRPLDGRKPALVVVDMTDMFIDPGAPLGSPMGPAVLEANASLLAATRDAGLPIFFTKGYPDGHVPGQAERGRWRSPPAEDGWDRIASDLEPREDETIIYKGSKPSAFFGTSLAAHVMYLGVDSVIVTGMTTSGCVRATAVDAFQYNLEVIVPHDAVGDRSEISHAVSLFDLHAKYTEVIDTKQAIRHLQTLDRTAQ